ncbi:MAG: nuclear transport factor 2 family protein [Fulvivirga sp.]|uniref:nuclear transport factor 2 family protein n=1 Tax=Fulvivirga sp. TaxID=1931237 RepID=UPI0032EADE39
MTTQEIAKKWLDYCQSGQMEKAQEELYADNCVSLEMEGAEGFPQRVEGKKAIKEKGELWNSMVEAFHGVEIEEPLVAGNHFTTTLKMDITMKGAPRRTDEEVAIFRVENGKIVSEQFFYDLN